MVRYWTKKLKLFVALTLRPKPRGLLFSPLFFRFPTSSKVFLLDSRIGIRLVSLVQTYCKFPLKKVNLIVFVFMMLPKTQRPHMIALGRSHMMAAASMQGSSASARGGTGSVLNRYRLVLAVWAVVLVFGSAFLLSDETSRSGTSAGAGVQELRAPGEAPALQPRKRTPGHQHCDADGGSCTCDKGYTGEHCEQAICEQGCMRGKCLRPSYCTCEEGYKGRACDEPVCTRGCGHGQCVQPEFCRTHL